MVMIRVDPVELGEGGIVSRETMFNMLVLENLRWSFYNVAIFSYINPAQKAAGI